MRIALIRSQETPDVRELSAAEAKDLSDPSGGWDKFASGPVETYTAPGDHLTIFAEPHVQTLAETLTIALANARESDVSGAE